MPAAKKPRAPRTLKKETRVRHEADRLTSLLVTMDPSRLKSVEKLIDRCAFYAITLEDLEDTMNREGVVSEYQNGEAQWGTKRSPEADLHVAMFKNYLAGVKQLVDLLPDTGGKPKGDELLEFINQR